jgi:ferredoxin--NADP+ reductase
MKIVAKTRLADNLVKLVISSPLIAQSAQPGQFIMFMVTPESERVPLTIVDSDKKNGTITIIFQEVGYSTKLLGTRQPGDFLYSLVGPLGKPTHIENYGNVIISGGGAGIAELLPVVKALKAAGCRLTTILGGRTKDLVILRDELKVFSDTMYITTDDGSLGEKGLVIDPLKRLLTDGKKYGLVFCVGPVPMMRAVCDVTRPVAVKTLVCLNSIMLDGTGMCGSCRLTYNGEVKFCCVDGPDFDGHLVDFAELSQRQKRFISQEKKALEMKSHVCKIGR